MASSRKSLGILKTSRPERNPIRGYLLGVPEVEAVELAGFFFFLLDFDFLCSGADLPASAALVASGAFAGAAALAGAAAGAALGAGAGAGVWAAADSAKAPTRSAVRSLLIVAVFRG